MERMLYCPGKGQYNILDNTTFFLTNIHKFSTFSSFCNVRFYLNFLIDFLSFILPVEDGSSGSRKLVVF